MKFKRLNEIASVVDSLHQTPKYSENGIPMVRVTDIKGGRLSLRDCLKVDEEIYEKFTSNHKPQYGDIIVSRVGTYGVFSFVATNDRFCLGQNTAIITPHINSDFVYYCLISQIVKNQIEKKVVGSTQKTLSLKSIRELAIPDIDNDTQLIVSSILKCIDKRIALNSMINDNLEQQAQAIFKSWFVDFEPFGGVMPDDWMVTTFDSICDFKNGYAFKSKELLKNPDSECYEVFKQGHILKGGGFNAFGTKSWFPKNKCEKLAKFVLKRNDILMAMTDMKGNVAILGNTAILPEDNRYILNQRVGLLRPKTQTGISPAYIYLLTNSNDFLFDLRSRANSGVQVNLSADAIRNSEVVLAPKDICRKFSEIVDPLIEKTLDNQIENQRLAALRDTLLPKLMNGEIDVSQVKI